MSELGFEKQSGSSVQGLTFVRPLPQLSHAALSDSGSDRSSARPLSSAIADRLFPQRTALDSGIHPPVAGMELGHFVIEERIGRGGMGAVFRAIDKRLDRVVALKVLSPEFANDPDAVIRFQNEARSAARLDHDNIARVHYTGSEGSIHFIAFEFVIGTNIRTLITQKGRLSPAESVNYTLQMAEALRQTFAANVVHRDIKPSNIIVSTTGRAKLVDLGLARHLDPEASRDLTVAGTALGTFDYIAPEQAMDARNVDVRSDLYSLGCTLYHMLTGAPPYPNGTMFEKVMNHHRPDPPNPADRVSGISPELAAVVQKLMASKPDDRYANPDSLIADLIPIAQSLGLEPSPADTMIWTRSEPHRSRPRWNGAPTWVSVAMLLLILVLADRLRIPQRPDPISETATQLGVGTNQIPIVNATHSDTQNLQIPDSSASAPLPVPNHEQPEISSTTRSTIVPSSESAERMMTDRNTTPALKQAPAQPLLENSTGMIPIFRLEQAERLWNEPLVNLLPTLVPSNGATPGPSSPMMFPSGPSTESGRPLDGADGSRSPVGPLMPNGITSNDGSATARPPVTTEPFVVIDPATDKRYPRSTFAAACALAKDNWAIEVQQNANPLIQQEPFVITDKRIRVRPARDYQPGRDLRPLIRFDLSNQQMLGSYNELTEVIRVNRGALELYDLDIELIVSSDTVSEWALITLLGGSRLTGTGTSFTIVNPFNRTTTCVSIPENESQELSDLMPERMAGRTNIVELQDCVVRGQFDFLTQHTTDPLSIRLQNTAVAISGRLLQLDGSNSYRVTTQPDANRAISLSLDHVTVVTGNGLIKATSGEHGVLPLMKIGLDNCVFRVDAAGLPLIEISGNDDGEILRESLQVEPSRNRSFFQLTGPFCLIQSSTSLLSDAERELGPDELGLSLVEVSPESRIVLQGAPNTNTWHSIFPADLDLKQSESNPAIAASGDLQNAGVNWQSIRLPRLVEASVPTPIKPVEIE